MMKKKKVIERYGKERYEKNLEQSQQWRGVNPEKVKEQHRQWSKTNPEKVKEHSHDIGRKGGKGYLNHLKYQTTGIPGERNRVRMKHQKKWREYKKIIAPDSQIHHSWRPGTAEYDGVALVEKEQHQHGIIDVIQILDGTITLFSEEEIRGQ